MPWAVVFSNEYAHVNVGVPLFERLHPTQLYEAGAELAIFLFLIVFERRGRAFPGRTFWTYVLLYSASRFVIEFYRGDPRGMIGPLATSQFVSAVLVPAAAGLLVWLARRDRASAPKARARSRRKP